MYQHHRLTHALTFDIEDWFHLLDLPVGQDWRNWPTLPTLVERYTHLILDELDEVGVRGTFFIVGWVAEQYPKLAPEIAARGHEVASHSYLHRPVDQLSEAVFRADLHRAVDVLEQQIGEKLLGFRAPGFRIDSGQAWFHEALMDEGLRYDASVVPTGDMDGPADIHWRFLRESQRWILEFPISVMRVGPVCLKGGGGYMRLMPGWMARQMIQHYERRGRTAVVYLHPRDFAPDCPRIPMPRQRQFRCYYGLDTMLAKLRTMIRSFHFDSAASLAMLHDESAPAITPRSAVAQTPAAAAAGQVRPTAEPLPWAAAWPTSGQAVAAG